MSEPIRGAGGFGSQVNPPRPFSVWKYALAPDKFDNGCASTVIKMPAKARILSIETINNEPVVYALVETDNVEVERTFVIVPTGGRFGDHAQALISFDVGGDFQGPLRFVGTFQVTRNVKHPASEVRPGDLVGADNNTAIRVTTLVFHVFAYPESMP